MPTQKYRVDTDKGSYEVEVEAPEPETKPLRGTTQAGMIGNTMLDAAKGFAGGVVPGAYHAVVSAVPSLVQAAIGTVKGTANLLTDPVGTLTAAYEAVKDAPGKGGDILQQALDLARKDPEAFGRMVGETTGAAEAGIAGSKALPLAPKPIARAIGSTMEQVGTKGRWPIRMMGAHQLGSGNPMGVATMMLPEGLEKAGGALQDFGGGVSHGRRADIKATSKAERDAWSMVDKEKADAEKIQANKDRLTRINAAKSGRTAAEPAISETVSAETPEGRQSMTTKFNPTEEAVNPEITALKKQGYSDEVIAKLMQADKGGMSKPGPGAIRIAPPTADSPLPEAKGGPVSQVLDAPQILNKGAEMGKRTVGSMQKAGYDVSDTGFRSTKDIDRLASGPDTVVPADLTFEGEEGINPVPPSAGGSVGPKTTLPDKPGVVRMTAPGSIRLSGPPTVPVPDEWLDAVDKAMKPTGSKSKSFLGANLSSNDVQAATRLYRANPDMSPEDVAAQLEQLKASRHGAYYENAVNEKKLRSITPEE